MTSILFDAGAGMRCIGMRCRICNNRVNIDQDKDDFHQLRKEFVHLHCLFKLEKKEEKRMSAGLQDDSLSGLV